MKKANKRGKIRNATPLIFDGIQFRSKLEVYCYQELKKHHLEAQYEQITYELVKPFTFMGKWLESTKTGLKLEPNKVRPMTYTPDFVGDNFIIECKGFANEQWPIKKKLIKQHLQYLDAMNVFVPSNRKQIDEIINIIKNGYK